MYVKFWSHIFGVVVKFRIPLNGIILHCLSTTWNEMMSQSDTKHRRFPSHSLLTFLPSGGAESICCGATRQQSSFSSSGCTVSNSAITHNLYISVCMHLEWPTSHFSWNTHSAEWINDETLNRKKNKGSSWQLSLLVLSSPPSGKQKVLVLFCFLIIECHVFMACYTDHNWVYICLKEFCFITPMQPEI